MEYISYLLEVRVPRRYSILVFFVLFFLAYGYLYLLGLGLFNNTVFCMLGVNNTSQEHGAFIPTVGQTKEVDCSLFNRTFPQFASLNNVVTEPRLVTGANDGSAEQFCKLDKSIIATNNLSLKDRCSLSFVSSEPKCLKVLGKFVKQVLPGEENGGNK
jgi:hypothetical protein